MTKKDKQQAFENLLKDIRDFVGNDDDKENYIFRGEAKQNLEISSNLYRQFNELIGVENFHIGEVQSGILKSVKKHIKEEDGHNTVSGKSLYQERGDIQTQEKNNAILEQLQHYGGQTNQIDFTTDYLIALFFACEAEPEDDGRLIFLEISLLKYGDTIYKPKTPKNRVIAQKSIFFRPPSGMVEADKIIVIDKRLKGFICSYLSKHHSINSENIYNDIHGFIDRNRNYKDGYIHLHLGFSYYEKKDYDKAIKHYTEALKQDRFFSTYNHRGIAYAENGNHDDAIADFTKAIEVNSHYIEAYENRGVSKEAKQNYKGAREDLEKALLFAEQQGKQSAVTRIQKIIDKLPADSDS